MNKSVEEHLENLKEFYHISDIKDSEYLKKLIVRNINDVLNRYRKYDKVSMGKLIQEVLEQKHKIDKAIEWIKEDYDGGYFECGESDIKELLKILGDDNNE